MLDPNLIANAEFNITISLLQKILLTNITAFWKSYYKMEVGMVWSNKVDNATKDPGSQQQASIKSGVLQISLTLKTWNL